MQELQTPFQKVMDMVTNKVREVVTKVYEEHPEYLSLSEVELEERLDPSKYAREIRMTFWNEYNRAQDNGSRMIMFRVFSPVMSEAHFYENFLTEQNNVAWMMCRPSDYYVGMANDRNKLQMVISQTLKAHPLRKGEDGSISVDIKLFNAYIRLFEVLSNRIDGSVIQRIAQKTETTHIHKDPTKDIKELELLEKKYGKSSND